MGQLNFPMIMKSVIRSFDKFLHFLKEVKHVMCSRVESNHDHLLRREIFYPLNYESGYCRDIELTANRPILL